MTCFDESISVRGRCSRSLRAVFLLGFLLYGLTVTAQETGRDEFLTRDYAPGIGINPGFDGEIDIVIPD